MNRRRMMMMQQINGIELVYDALSGELPQEKDGWKLTISDKAQTVVQNGYLTIQGNGSHVSPLLTIESNKKQNHNKSKELTVKVGNIVNATLVMAIVNLFFFTERYPNTHMLIYKDWDNPFYREFPKSVEYEEYRIVYDAKRKMTSFYKGNSLIYNTYTAEPKDLIIMVSGSHYMDIARITYKEW